MAGIGIDGCRAGWMYFHLGDGGEAGFGVEPSLAAVLDRSGERDRILVDVPIGLPEGGPDERRCDTESRRLLGSAGRGRSVFPVPCRPAAYAPDYESANRIQRELTGRGLSKQSWGLVAGIREADRLMRTSEAARARIREAHPELLFWALAGRRPMSHSKKSQEGLLERVEVLEAVFPGAEELAAAAFVAHGGVRVARDDVVDALVAAVSAWGPRELVSVPEVPPLDPFGIPMHMVYPAV